MFLLLSFLQERKGVNGGGYSGFLSFWHEEGRPRALNVLVRYVGSGARLLGFLTLFPLLKMFSFGPFWACPSFGSNCKILGLYGLLKTWTLFGYFIFLVSNGPGKIALLQLL